MFSSASYYCFSFFRTMGLRHLIVLDGDHRVIGIVTRKDITEHRLEHHWFQEGDNMQKFINVDPMEPGLVYEHTGLLRSSEMDANFRPSGSAANVSIAEMEEGSSSILQLSTMGNSTTSNSYSANDQNNALLTAANDSGGVGTSAFNPMMPPQPPPAAKPKTTKEPKSVKR
jgi:hypothetical protein